MRRSGGRHLPRSLGLVCSLAANRYEARVLGPMREGQATWASIGPQAGEKKRPRWFADAAFFLGLGFTLIGIALQTWAAMT